MKHPDSNANRHRYRGFSLVEIMIALLITGVLLTGISQIFIGTKRSYRIQDSVARMHANGRYALQTVMTDLRRAGYFGGLPGTHQITDNTAGGIRNLRSVASDDGSCNSINWVRMLTHPVFGTDDHRLGYDCLPHEPVHTGDILVTRYAAPWIIGGNHTAADHMTKHPDHLYLRTSLTNGRLFAGKNEAANPVNGNTRTAELVAHAYFIRNRYATVATDCPGNRQIPTLYRMSQVNGKLVAQEVARGIEQFQVQYGIDTDNDNRVDRYVDAIAATDPRWQQLVAVRVWLLARAECPETQYDNTHQYLMGNTSVRPASTDQDGDGRIDGDVDGDGNDDYRRRLYLNTVALRNH